MIRHVVMWKMKTEFQSDEKFEKALAIKQALEGLKTLIPEIVDIEVGISGSIGSGCCCGEDKGDYDICLVSSFNSMTDLETYAKHPEHVKAAGLVKEAVNKRVCVDYIV